MCQLCIIIAATKMVFESIDGEEESSRVPSSLSSPPPLAAAADLDLRQPLAYRTRGGEVPCRPLTSNYQF